MRSVLSPMTEPWPFRAGDIPPGENPEKARAALERFQLEEVRRDEAFALGYDTLDVQFGPVGEIERRDVLGRWFRERSLSRPEDVVQVTYHMSLVWEGSALAAVRDDFTAVDRETGRVVAFMSHSLSLIHI